MSLTDDISKFCKDLVLGDFEEEPGNAAMIVGGLISLIPIADQVLDVRDLSGMIYRVSNKGANNCKTDDWVDLSLAAFGCVPELGSLFKTIVKPLWKRRAALRGTMRGEAFISAMLGKAKGKAITFIKTLDWAGNTQLAIQQMDAALTACDQFLAELEKSRWWVPDSLEGLARDLRPGLKSIRGPLHTGIQQGIRALRQFVTELVGEDGYRVAQLAVAAASSSSSPASRKAGARGSNGPSRSSSQSRQAPAARSDAPTQRRSSPPAEQQQAKHKQQRDTNRQQVERGGGPMTTATRVTRASWKAIGNRYKGLIGEHMAHYYHMKLHAPEAWPHGKVEGRHKGAEWKGPKRLVTEQNMPATPTELIPEHLVRVNQNGVDGVWSMGNNVFHFVEAKASESAGALFGKAAESWRERVDGKRSARIPPPAGLTERQYALWCMLSQPRKGLQMSLPWLRRSVSPTMLRGNEEHRFTYVFFAIPSASPPKGYAPGAGRALEKGVSPGIIEHVAASAKIGAITLSGGDVYDLALHDEHKPTHGLSDRFSYHEHDELNDIFERERKLVGTRNRGRQTSGTLSRRNSSTRRNP
ncbi:conserved protein of unknown function [Cupriavidus taiwanensis]|uniref:hypothetical protein n=1 Tax=Cupriavidus taiwanensis TaxID=164546 RepID=UPI000E10C0EA|nr:hypothetical protein [Cupriavidus taiwanensis]SPA42470.1 conserved protein of unknown function [Cupriavidus taiwanensis]